MPRPYHSPSSIELGRRCERAWAYRYIAGLREPEVAWSDILAGASCTNKQRALARGKAVHAIFEEYYQGGSPDWTSVEGQIAEPGLVHLPDPEECATIQVEAPIGNVPIDVEGGPPTALRAAGILWAGYRDLTVVDAEGRVRLYDYKTTSSIAKWAKSADDLAADLQCNLYALDVMSRPIEFGVISRVAGRWVYFETGKARRAVPVDVEISRDGAERVVADAAEVARRLDVIPSVEAAACNPAACADYGGCMYHQSAGGPCNARRSIGAMIQSRVGRNGMAMKRNLRDKFKAASAEAAPSAAAEKAETPPAAEKAETPPADAPAEKATPPPRRGRKPKASKGPAPFNIKDALDEMQDLTLRVERAEDRIIELRAAIERAVSGT